MKSPFIYVVNIQVPKNLLSDYLIWLKAHISEMTALPQFTDAELYECKSLNTDSQYLRVHYHLSSERALQEYLNGPAKKMRSQLPSEFQGQISIERETLNFLD